MYFLFLSVFVTIKISDHMSFICCRIEAAVKKSWIKNGKTEKKYISVQQGKKNTERKLCINFYTFMCEVFSFTKNYSFYALNLYVELCISGYIYRYVVFNQFFHLFLFFLFKGSVTQQFRCDLFVYKYCLTVCCHGDTLLIPIFLLGKQFAEWYISCTQLDTALLRVYKPGASIYQFSILILNSKLLHKMGHYFLDTQYGISFSFLLKGLHLN